MYVLKWAKPTVRAQFARSPLPFCNAGKAGQISKSQYMGVHVIPSGSGHLCLWKLPLLSDS